jgi:hypothetical protein
MTVTKHRTCANCGGRAVPIIYGMVGVDAFEAEQRGEIALGGCEIIEGETAAWRCTKCGIEFGQLLAG